MQFRFIASVALFLGSYLPLALILLVQDANYTLVKNGLCWEVWGRHSSCVLSFCVTLMALSVSRPKLPIKLVETKYIPAELMSYTLPYVVSFMSIGYQETGKFAGLTIFLAWMFWITHKSGQILVNPLLTVFGWRLYEIKYAFPGDTTLHNGRALAKGLIEPGKQYPHVLIQDIVVLRPTTTTEER